MTFRKIIEQDLKFISFVDKAIKDYKEEALNPKKEVFGLSGKEEELANKEAEQEELPQYSDDETGMDFTGADCDPDR